MKRTKRVVSILLALLLGLGMGVPAVAVEESDPSVISVIMAQEETDEPGEDVPSDDVDEDENPPPWWAYLVAFGITVPLGLPIGLTITLLLIPFFPLSFMLGPMFPLVAMNMIIMPIMFSVMLPAMGILWLLGWIFGFDIDLMG